MHKFSESSAQFHIDYADVTIQNKLSNLDEMPTDMLRSIGAVSKDCFNSMVGLRSTDDINKYLETACNAYTAPFSWSVRNSMKRFVSILNQNYSIEHELKQQELNLSLGYGYWFDALYISIILKDFDALDTLISFDINTFRKTCDTDEFIHQWVAFWWHVLRGEEEEARDSMLKTLEHLQPGKYDPLFDLDAQRIHHEIALWHSFRWQADVDDTRFNDTLAEALVWHESYYEIYDEEKGIYNSDKPQGFVATNFIAIALVAQDFGYTVTLENDYLYPPFLNGEHHKQYNTPFILHKKVDGVDTYWELMDRDDSDPYPYEFREFRVEPSRYTEDGYQLTRDQLLLKFREGFKTILPETYQEVRKKAGAGH